jgi:NAD(P)-dependent dehydrogenase (short-subunit alcohol dehydrogenase family)
VRDNKEMNTMISSLTALGRVGLADDVGSVVAFLCSEEAKWVNAQRIEVAGGIFI